MPDTKTKGVSRLYLDGLLFFTLSIPAFLLTAQSWFILTLDWQWKHVMMSGGTSFLTGLQFFLITAILLLLGFWYIAFWCLLMRNVCREIVPQGGWNLKPDSVWWAFIPVLGIIYAIGILVDLSLRRSRAAMAMLAIHLSSLAAIPLIFIYLPVYKVNLNLVLLLFVVSTASAICHYSLLANKRPSKLGYLLAWPLLGVILLNVAFAYYSMYSIDRRVEQADAVLAALGVPTSREKAKEFYYQGIQPDQYFTNLVEQELSSGKQPFAKAWEKYKKILNYNPKTSKKSENELRKDFVSSSANLFAAIDKLGENDKPLKVELDYNQPLCNIPLPELNFARDATRIYRLRIIEAVDAKDRAETMRLFKLAFRVLSNIAEDSFLIGGLVGIACDNIMLETLEHMLSASILTDSDLAEIDSILRRKESGIRIHAQHSFQGDTAMCNDMIDAWLKCELNTTDPTKAFSFVPNIPNVRNILGLSLYHIIRNNHIIMAEFFQENSKVLADPTEYYDRKNLFSASQDTTRFKNLFPKALMNYVELQKWKIIYEKFVSLEARLRMAQIALKIEQSKLKNGGRLPDSLAELSAELHRDPFSGNDFKYEHGLLTLLPDDGKTKKEVSGYRLYGTGPNLKHDSYFTVVNGQ